MMSRTSGGKSAGIPVRMLMKTGEIDRGTLLYKREGPVLRLGNGDIYENHEGVRFSFHEDSELAKKLGSDKQFTLSPEIVIELNYSPELTSRIQMYPPSTDGWLTHVVDTGYQSVFTVQKVIGTDKKLLTVIDSATGKVYFGGLVLSYEPAILMMNRDWIIYNEIIHSDSSDTGMIDDLKNESVSWSTLSNLVEGVTIPNLSMKETAEETLSQLVPASFSPAIRKQIISFLGWLDDAEIPNEDPVEFAVKLGSVRVYRTLVRGHIKCLVDNVESPQYVRILQLADRGQLEFSERAPVEAAETDSWYLVNLKLDEIFPSWMGRVVQSALYLQNQDKIVTDLPISRDDARKSRKAWSERFAMANHGLFMRGHINKESLGLIPVQYIGGAHRWPHKHLEWSARIGFYEKPQYIQIMLMPSSAIERITRILPTLHPIDWEMSSVNLSLFNDQEQKWKTKTSLISKSLERKRSLRQLTNEFHKWKGNKFHQLSQEQARILDLISWGFYLSSLEFGRYTKYSGKNNSEILQELEYMRDQGLFNLQYFLIPKNLRSLCINATGPSVKICSLSRAFLKHTPSTQIRITEQGTSCTIISRVPDDEYHSFARAITETATENNVSLKTYPISAYAGYRNNLYSRLLKMDGTWDDDVSGLLSQVRLRLKYER